MKVRAFGFTALFLALVSSTTSFGAFDLQITEMWPGQSGSDISEDWIEITNLGDMAWTTSDGDLFVEDGSGSDGIVEAVQVAGLSSIAPNQSVIVLFEGTMQDALDFPALWGTSVSVGYADGSGIGLGGGGETAYLFLSDGSLLDDEEYPDTESSPLFISEGYQSESWDVTLRAWSSVGNPSGAFESLALGGEFDDQAAIASPGGPRVPEPSTIALTVVAALGVLAVRRR